MVLDYEVDIPALYPYLEFELEEGEPLMKERVALLQKEAVSIRYEDGCVNLVVYDPNQLTVLTIHQQHGQRMKQDTL